MSELRFGVLGASRIVAGALLEPASRRNDVRVAAVAAREPQRAVEFAAKHGLEMGCSYQALLDDESIEAVYIALPTAWHGFWTRAALRAGKHVLCEKPLAANAAEAREMVAEAERAGRILQEAVHDDWHPFAAEMQALCRRTFPQGPRRLQAVFTAPISPSDIRRQLELGGGAMMDLGCYPLRWVRRLTGEEPRVVGAKAVECSPGVDESMTAELVFPGGATARVHCSMAAECSSAAHITVSDGTTVVSLANPLAPHTGNSLRVIGGGRSSQTSVEGESTYSYQLAGFLAALRGQAPARPADALANMELLDAVYRAAQLPLREGR